MSGRRSCSHPAGRTSAGVHDRKKIIICSMAQNNALEASFGIIPVRLENGVPRFLLVRHRAGHWGFPKGHAEPGETPLEAACREFEEETGIREYEVVPGTSFREHYTRPKKGRLVNKTVTYFLAYAATDEVACQETEISDYRWAAEAEARDLITYPESREILRHAAAEIEKALAAAEEPAD